MMKTMGAVCALVLLVPTLARAKGADKPAPAEDDAADNAKADSKTENKADAKDDKADAKADAKTDAKPDAKTEDTSEGGDQAATTGKPVGRVTLPGGTFLIDVIVEANLADSAIGKPISVAPDLWIGVADKFTFGLVHSGRGSTGFLTSVVNGLCFRGGGDTGVCAAGLGKIYTSVGAEGRIGLAEGSFALAVPIGVYATAFDPKIVLSAKIGLLARIGTGPVALEVAPVLFAGLTQRTADVNGVKVSTNEERVAVPVTLFFKLSPAFAIAAQSGISFVAEDAKHTYQVPAALGIAWWATPKFSLDLAFGLGAVLDSNSMTKAFDSRNATIGVGYGM